MIQTVGPSKDDFDVEAQPVDEGAMCEACYLNYLEHDFFSLDCKHSFCVNCHRDHLQTRIHDGNAINLPCMHQKCPEIYKAEQI